MFEVKGPKTGVNSLQNKHITIDLGTGNKINWTMEDKQEM
uniref:Uncharacterized protein n=1 Tax=Pygocentrus nattereri TaxID=42514 RepID=A0AAR2IUV3_PYGNA